MESESKQVKQHEMEVLDILKEAVKVYVKNINFITFTIVTSLPFFCVMIYFELLFQKTVVEASEFLSQKTADETVEVISLLLSEDKADFNYVHELGSFIDKIFSKDYLPVLIQLGFIYLVPLQVLELCSAILTMDLASKLRSGDNNLSLTLKQMFQNSIIDISIMKGTFITSLYMLFLSACLLIAFPWTLNNFYCLSEAFGDYIFSAIISLVCCLVLAKLLMVYLEWSSILNMSIVISVLDGIYGFGALRVSYAFSRGNQKRGLFLMLVFFVLGLCLRLSCLSLESYERGIGIFVQIGVLTVVNTLKWVSCMIYFYDCKKRTMEKKVDEELGKAIEEWILQVGSEVVMF
ncbi:uncharacterized protein LOC130713754 [Lotus japonicus]|uniref:uncharacterized protein LOC130713754 n=1 Tax=Lotus japonicus TaxID=34305 RepID=UPI0025844689|nr:uncharacterized protein LOC130713754 [Lotus japonicus]